MDSSKFDLNSDQVDIELRSDSNLMKIYGTFIKTFKTPIVYSTQVSLNMGFKTLFNRELASIQSDYQKVFSSYIIETFFNILPVVGQEIYIPHETFVSYAMCDERRANIENGRINAYFTGDIINMEYSHLIKDDKYLQQGDLDLDMNGAPYQFQVSSKVINEIFELIFGYNQLEMKIPY